VIVAVYVVFKLRLAFGVNVAMSFAYVTVPLTAPPPCAASVKVALVSVVAFIASLKVAVSAAVIDTPVAPLSGVTAVTVGAGGGGAAAVVNDQLSFALSAVPPVLCAPVVIVAVYCVLYASALLGVNVATLPA
jgi:hypothetical protein